MWKNIFTILGISLQLIELIANKRNDQQISLHQNTFVLQNTIQLKDEQQIEENGCEIKKAKS